MKTVRDGAFEGCSRLETLKLGYQIKQLGRFLFKGCFSFESLEVVGNFDKLEKFTFSGADVLESLSLWIHADSLYFPPDGFADTPCLKEIIVSGTFEPIVEKRSCFPENIVIKGYFDSPPLKVLSFYFESEVIS